jgi:hypothetical protein
VDEVVDESDDDWELIPYLSAGDLARCDDDDVELRQASAESGAVAPRDVDTEVQGASAGSKDLAATEKVNNTSSDETSSDEALKRFVRVLELLV